ncbi:MAG: iron-containing alcohol dehydrogenase [Mediterraneibacter gnavus]
MPAKITAETGMDALTHALEALASNRAETMYPIFWQRSAAIEHIMENLPKLCARWNRYESKEKSCCRHQWWQEWHFANVSLVESYIPWRIHWSGVFHISHGLADAILPSMRHSLQ